MLGSVTFEPIGVIESPFTDKVDAPRQASAAAQTIGRVRLFDRTGYRDALSGIEGFSHVWLLFVFDRATSFSPKVAPPRAHTRVGVFATRSPHRPNRLGMSLVELVSREDLVLNVRGLDVLDGTPVLDVKPYLSYADSVTESGLGWLAERDPLGPVPVTFSDRARRQLKFLQQHGGTLEGELESRIQRALELGGAPHAYKRIRPHPSGGSVLAVKAWRARFEANGRAVEVKDLASGYKPKQLHGDSSSDLDVHRAFVASFGWDGVAG